MTSIEQRVIWRSDKRYERFRLASSRAHDWNYRHVDRYPDGIVVAESIEDVQAAVRFAKERGLKVKARSGGHSWTDSSVREGLLIDLAKLDKVEVDPENRTAIAGPGVMSQELSPQLTVHGLSFPSGGCEDVGLGGYLLQGGFGFDAARVGVACSNVLQMKIVTADGDLIVADDTQNQDWFWAARGSGSGFFGIVVEFKLRLHPFPRTSLTRVVCYPLEDFAEVARWMYVDMEERMPKGMEFAVFSMRKYQEMIPGATGPLLSVAASINTDEDEQFARDALALIDDAPFAERMVFDTGVMPYEANKAHEHTNPVYPPGGLIFVADNYALDIDPDELVPLCTEIVNSFPTDRSHLLITTQRDWTQTTPDEMAFSVYGKFYVAVYGVKDLDDNVTEDELVAWTSASMEKFGNHGKGVMMADENLYRRPYQVLVQDNLVKLEELRKKYDPEGRFHSFLLPKGQHSLVNA